MANTAAIEVFGPFGPVRDALLQLPDAGETTTNSQGSFVVELGDHALVAGYDEVTDSTLIVVDGRDTDLRAVEVFHQLAKLLPYAMEVTDADLTGVIASRDAVPAA